MLAGCFFARVLEPAEVDPGAATRFLRRHAGGEVRCDGLLNVEAELVIDVAGPAALEEKAQARERFCDHRSASAGWRPSTRATAVERRSQVASSASSCFLPARVSA